MNIQDITLYRTSEEGRHFHSHPHYQLHFIFSGEGYYEIAGQRRVKASPETFFVVPPKVDHRILLPANSFLLEYLVDMIAQDNDDPVKTLLDNELGAIRAFSDVSMNRKYFEVKREQFKRGNRYAQRAAELSLLSWLYGFCSRRIAHQHRSENDPSDEVEIALQILHDDIEKPLNLETLARRVGINRFSLVRKFTRQVGISPMKYFSRLKLECAAMLLKESGMNIGKVAERLGFSDQYHFSKRFKAAYSMSPSQYRKKEHPPLRR